MVRQVLDDSETGGRVVAVVEDANHSENRPGKLWQAPPNERFLSLLVHPQAASRHCGIITSGMGIP